MAEQKIIGWGKCAVKNGNTTHNDIVQGSTALSVEEGQETEALIEGGEAEARKREPDKYTLTYNRRIGSENEVEVGFVENAGDAEVIPENAGAIGVKLSSCSRSISVKFDSTDGLVAVYTYKTKGAHDDNGKLTDVTFHKKGAAEPTYTAVTVTTGKNPKTEGWYVKSGSSYVLTTDTEPQSGTTYYIKS